MTSRGRVDLEGQPARGRHKGLHLPGQVGRSVGADLPQPKPVGAVGKPLYRIGVAPWLAGRPGALDLADGCPATSSLVPGPLLSGLLLPLDFEAGVSLRRGCPPQRRALAVGLGLKSDKLNRQRVSLQRPPR